MNARLARAQLISLMVLLTTASYFHRTIMAIAGTDIARELSLSATQMGAVYSAFVLGYALAMIPAGRLADWLGPRRTLTLYAAGAALFTALTAFPGSWHHPSANHALAALLAIRFGLGVVTAPLFPSTGKMNESCIPSQHRTFAQGWIVAGAGIGGALAPLVFVPLLTMGWRSAFLWTSAATVAIAVVWDRTARDTHPGGIETSHRPSLAEWRLLVCNRNLLLLTLGYGSLGYFEYLFFFWIFYYLGQIKHLDAAQSGFYTSVLWLAWLVMAPLGGVVSDKLTIRFGERIGPRIVPIAGLTLSVTILVVAMRLPTPQAVALAIALSIGMAAFTDSSYWVAAINIGGKHSGAAGGILNTGSNVGGLIAPVLTPWIASRVGWTNAIYLGCVLVAAGILLWPWIDARPRREETASPPLHKTGL